MKQYETYKVYGNAKKIGNDYYEVPYTEYLADGTIKCEGTEDFSRERLHKGTKKLMCIVITVKHCTAHIGKATKEPNV